MSTIVSIAKLDVYTTDGSHDTTLYEVNIEEGDEYLQKLQLESTAALVSLRNTLSTYINENNLDSTHHEH